MNLSPLQYSIILASLRHFQFDLEACVNMHELSDIVNLDSFNSSDIDRLCEDINFGSESGKNIESIDDWFESVNDSAIFIVNGKVCTDFSYPTHEEEEDVDEGEVDDTYSFYFHDSEGFTTVTQMSSSHINKITSAGIKEVICQNDNGYSISIRAIK
mgnify:CR=1 FL=1